VPDENGDWQVISRPNTGGDLSDIGIIGGADGPTAIIVGKDVYRYCTDEEGLYVFIWQLAGNSYSCCVMEKTKEGYTYSDLWDMKSIGLEAARAVVISSGYSKEAVTIVPFSMPYSSYSNLEASENPEGYQRKLEELFWGE